MTKNGHGAIRGSNHSLRQPKTYLHSNPASQRPDEWTGTTLPIVLTCIKAVITGAYHLVLGALQFTYSLPWVLATPNNSIISVRPRDAFLNLKDVALYAPVVVT